MTWVAVTATRDAVEPTGKAFTVQFKTFTVTAIASSEVLGWMLQGFLGLRVL